VQKYVNAYKKRSSFVWELL